MTITTPSSDVQKARDDLPDRAIKQARRDAVATADLTDDEAAVIAAARTPPEHRYSVDEDA